jgi:hypothetical protein
LSISAYQGGFGSRTPARDAKILLSIHVAVAVEIASGQAGEVKLHASAGTALRACAA